MSSEASNLSDFDIHAIWKEHKPAEGEHPYLGRARAIEAKVRASDSTARAATTDENADWLKGYTAGQSLAHAYYDNPQIKEARSIIESAAAALRVGGTARAEPVAADALVRKLVKIGREYGNSELCESLIREALSVGGAVAPSPEPTAEPKCQRCNGVIANCTGADCDGTGDYQAHWALSGVQPPNQPTAAANAAIRTLKALRYTWEGGEQWKPPLGVSPFARWLDEPTAETLRKAFDYWRKNTCPEFDPSFETHRAWANQFAWFAVTDVFAALSQSAGTLPQPSDVHPVESGGPLSDAPNGGRA